MRFRGRLAALLTSVISLALAVDGAYGATTEIGAVADIAAAAKPAPASAGGFTVQIGEAAGSYAVPAGYGTITAWRHSAGAASGALTFKVYRPTGTKQEFVAVASDTQTVTANTVHTFPVRIPVRPGDRIGLSSEDVELAYETSNLDDRIGFFGADPAPGTTRRTDGEPFQEFKLDVAATLQSDPGGAGDGPAPPADPSQGDGDDSAALPAASKLRISPRAFAAARTGPSARAAEKRGATVSYRLNAPARVRFTLVRTRTARRKGRNVSIRGGFTLMGRAGVNRFRFTGRLRARSLKPGTYTLVATPSAGGRSGRSARTRFRIIR